jgi:hypothetical protein
LVPVVFTRFDDCENLPLAASGPAVDIPSKPNPPPAYQQAGDLPVASSSGVVTLITCCHDEKAVAGPGLILHVSALPRCRSHDAECVGGLTYI